MIMENNKKQERNPSSGNDDLNGGLVEDHLNSDNAFSDKGLNNHRLTRESMKKSNTNT
ncbi:hypothetical protein F3157_05170 [Virgibacillus dakarensis]|uniref:Uncharacterized protein n=1 Tax=Lentibacillus populi TaxID=1827502 RepID=A0A9W5X4D2_9BACI|nr:MULTISPECIES: hypothetical protein [Bacillaceae]MBT2214369.1 hypothetical protein [Virgibacillus dakarensis]MTW85048.1 hypothetical protein [Virgibacillus dakarensis]GGB34326.1 hypothetical protein GCM10011409_09730 [Lentibacillus populi]